MKILISCPFIGPYENHAGESMQLMKLLSVLWYHLKLKALSCLPGPTGTLNVPVSCPTPTNIHIVSFALVWRGLRYIDLSVI